MPNYSNKVLLKRELFLFKQIIKILAKPYSNTYLRYYCQDLKFFLAKMYNKKTFFIFHQSSSSLFHTIKKTTINQYHHIIMSIKLVFGLSVYFSYTQVQATEQSLSLLVSGDYGNCPHFCWNGDRCSDDRCKGCFFSCPDEKCRKRQSSCASWCSTRSECSSHARCRDCVFCRSVSASCSIATFEDNRDIFDFKNDLLYWDQWLHSGKPYFHSGSPVFFDVNDDNKLDYFNSMHGHPSFLSQFKNRMELGLGTRVGDKLSIRNHSGRFICTDIDCGTKLIDAHGSVVMDLNGDGISDIYISNGGGFLNNPKDDSLNYDNWLFWGERQIDLESGEEKTVFRGGREAARKANLDMQLGRGRFNYLFDANNDGLLDVFSAQDRRVSNRLRPGVLLINQGNNTWEEDEGMKEYTRTMILTDADGDGYAREFIINRAFCYPARKGPAIDKSRPELGPYSKEVKRFCRTRPVGTPVVYRYNESEKSMEQISKQYKNFWAGEKWTNSCCQNGSPSTSGDCNAISIVSGDFDDDQIADHILLYSSKMLFFFSSDRQRGTLPDNSNYIGLQIKLPAYCNKANSMQLIDLDNDGKEEILVLCQNVGVYLLYTKGLRKIDWTLNNGCNGKGALGDLSNRFNHLPSKSVMTEFCNKYSNVKWGTAKRICRQFSEDGRLDFTKADAMSVVDINNDGFRDIVATSSFGHLRFFINKPTEKSMNNRFIGFRFIGGINGSKSNNYGIGATVIFVAEDSNGDTVKQFREISSAQHHTDMNGSKDDRMVFGLGTNLTPKTMIVRWSNGFEQIIRLHDWTFRNALRPIDILDTKCKFQASLFFVSR